jgi:hypothetical protein
MLTIIATPVAPDTTAGELEGLPADLTIEDRENMKKGECWVSGMRYWDGHRLVSAL